MFDRIEISENVSAPVITYGNTRILFEPCEDIHPADPLGVFPTPNGALVIDSTKPRIYKKWLAQIMSGISDSQRYKGLPMRRISGTDSHGARYSVVIVADPGNDSIQSIGEDWAGYLSGHSYNLRVQDYKAIGDSGIWSFRDPDSVHPFFGDPFSHDFADSAIVAAYDLIKD